MIYSNIILTFILILLLMKGYYNTKNKYWINQLLHNKHEIKNIVKFNKINSLIDEEEPKRTKYINLLNIHVNFITSHEKAEIINNIYINNLNEYDYKNIITLMNYFPYFDNKYISHNITYNYFINDLKILLQNHSLNSLITFYKKDTFIQEKSNIINLSSIKGTIISIPFTCYFKEFIYFPLYIHSIFYNFHDLHHNHVLEMIHTLHYKHYHDIHDIFKKRNDDCNLFPNCNTMKDAYTKVGLPILEQNKRTYCSLFKYVNTNIPTIITPFVQYSSYYFDIKNWELNHFQLHASLNIIQIGTQNSSILFNYLQTYHTKLPKFLCSILPSFSHLLHLIKNEILIIYIVLENIAGIDQTDSIKSIYFFKKSCKLFENKEILFCSNSINNTSVEIFLCAFKNILNLLNKKLNYHCFQIDNISNNDIIINNILNKYKSIYIEKVNLLFYNYRYKTLQSNHVLMII